MSHSRSFINTLTSADLDMINEHRKKAQKENLRRDELLKLLDSYREIKCFACGGVGHMCDECPLMEKVNAVIERDHRHLTQTFKSYLREMVGKRKEWEIAEVGEEEFVPEKEFKFLGKKKSKK
jgi:hypothetical protein